jgi:hypothetical protein
MSRRGVQIDHLDLASLEFVDLYIMTFNCLIIVRVQGSVIWLSV